MDPEKHLLIGGEGIEGVILSGFKGMKWKITGYEGGAVIFTDGTISLFFDLTNRKLYHLGPGLTYIIHEIVQQSRDGEKLIIEVKINIKTPRPMVDQLPL